MKNFIKKLLKSMRKDQNQPASGTKKKTIVPIKMLEIRPVTPLKKKQTRTDFRQEINHWRDNVRQVDKFLKRYSQKACY